MGGHITNPGESADRHRGRTSLAGRSPSSQHLSTVHVGQQVGGPCLACRHDGETIAVLLAAAVTPDGGARQVEDHLNESKGLMSTAELPACGKSQPSTWRL